MDLNCWNRAVLALPGAQMPLFKHFSSSRVRIRRVLAGVSLLKLGDPPEMGESESTGRLSISE